MNETRDLGLLATGSVMARVDREVILATGADRSRFLQGIVTGNVAGTAVGGGCHATLLTTKAHVVAEMRIFVRAEELYIVVAAGQGAPASQALSRYAIMDDFAVAPLADFALTALLGPAASGQLHAAGYPPEALASAPSWSHGDVAGPAGTLWLARARQLGSEGYWLGGKPAVITALTDRLRELGVSRLASDAADAARIEAGEPAWGREITEDHFPMEVGLADAIDYGKGCFLGQEPIVRVRDRGHVNWRLARLRFELTGGEQPQAGDRLTTETKAKAGRITSVARLPNGGGVALAIAHASVAAGQTVRIVRDQTGTDASDASGPLSLDAAATVRD